MRALGTTKVEIARAPYPNKQTSANMGCAPSKTSKIEPVRTAQPLQNRGTGVSPSPEQGERFTLPRPSPPLREDAVGAEAAAAALASILPPPPAVQHWLGGGDTHDAAGKPNLDLACAATEWLVNAVRHAHLSPTIKKAGRDLMACRSFTVNLEYLKSWRQILMPELKAALVALGDEAKRANAACNLAAVLTEEAILAIAPFNPDLIPKAASKKAPSCGSTRFGREENNNDGSNSEITSANPQPFIPPRNAVRQDLLMPSLTAAVSADYKRDWKQQPEHVYIHVLLLLGTALDPLFGEALNEIVSDLEGRVDVHAAPIKSFLRMLNKARSKEDHQQVELQPRPAMNIDVVRRLAAAATGEDVLELARMVAARFGGLSHLKCLPELAVTDPATADARFHMLPVMLTVVFAPAGRTVGGLLKDPVVRAEWAAMRAVRPGWAVSTEQWQADHDAAVAAFERCDPNELVRMHCEVQVVTTATVVVRKKMHEIYKVYRAENGNQLHADVAKPEPEPEDGTDLIEAAKHGRIATVKRLLCVECDSTIGSSSGCEHADLNKQTVDGGRSALYWAAFTSHLPVVVVLLEHGNADPNIARTDNGATPLCMAAQNGHVEVAAKLLEHSTTDPNQATTDDGATPLIMAAENGHVEVVAKLLEHSTTDPNQATSNNGTTPLCMAAENGHVEVVAKLLEHGATDPNQATTDNGATPLHMAAQYGRVEVVAKLLEHGTTDPNQATTDDGATPLLQAAQNGHVEVVAKLLEHGVTDVNQATSNNGATPLFQAAMNGHVEVVAKLLEHGTTDPNQAETTDRATPLFMAAQEGHLQIVEQLLAAGGQTGTILTSNGATDLWAACWKGHADVVRFLLDRPSVEIDRPSTATGPNTTPLEIAEAGGHDDCVALLRGVQSNAGRTQLKQ